jgi:nicotinamidase-related amidase
MIESGHTVACTMASVIFWNEDTQYDFVDRAVRGLCARGYGVRVVRDAVKAITAAGGERSEREWQREGVQLVSTDDVTRQEYGQAP